MAKILLYFDSGRTKEVVRARNATFVESKLYKDREDKASVNSKQTVDLEVDEISSDDEAPDLRRVEADEVVPAEEDVEIPTDGSSSSDEDSPARDRFKQHYVRRSTRATRKPDRFDPSPSVNYLLLTDDGEPESYSEALRHSDAEKWELAMKEATK